MPQNGSVRLESAPLKQSDRNPIDTMKTLVALLIAVPAVFLSAEHQEGCKVKVGEGMPEVILRTAAGRATKFEQYQGQKGTVVALHGQSGWMTDTLLSDLGPEIAEPFGGEGILVITVSTGVTAKVPDGITPLRMNKSEAESAFGKGRMPRVFVLDAEGKVAWFDIEYSQSTRRELKSAIRSLVQAE